MYHYCLSKEKLGTYGHPNHPTLSAKLYIQSTINIRKKVVTKAIWADKKWAGFSGRLACTSNKTEIQCTPDLVTSYLVTNPDLVTILQKTVFLLHKNILFSDNLVFSDPSI